MAVIARDATTSTQDVVEESVAEEQARTYTSVEYAKIKREAARLRRERNENAQLLQSLEQERMAESRKRQEELGQFQSLYETEQKAHQTYRSQVESQFLRMHLQQVAIAKGVPAAQARALAYPTEGLSLTDELQVEGDVDAVLDAFVAPFIQSEAEAPKPPQAKQPVVIGERPVDQKAEPLVGAAAAAKLYAEQLKGIIR